MGARARVASCGIYAAMLAAALTGRGLDASSLLPGVHEAASVRGGTAAWLTATAWSLLIAAVASRCWCRTASLRAAAAVVVPGQVTAFLAAEAVVRMASGRGPIDGDGLLGAGLQAALAMVLLLALTCAWVVAVRTAPLRVLVPSPPAARPSRPAPGVRPSLLTLVLLARGPPLAAGT